MRKLVIASLAIALALAQAGSSAQDRAPRQPSARERPWENGLPDDPGFFPLAVWLQAPQTAPRFKALGINVYVGLWKGPTVEQLDELERHGLYVICEQNEIGLENRARKVIAGWMHADEPDNAQPLAGGEGYGPPVAPERVVADYRRMRAADPTRPVLLNLGQGVAWDGWHGRGVRSRHPEDYPQYVAGCDIASFDVYPVVHDAPEVSGRLEFVGRGVQRLIDWCGGAKPVWACIETTHIGSETRMATPAQVRSEVWLALVHGATGIVYFVHEFKPKFIEAGLLAHPEMAAAVRSVNAEIAGLAPVLNAPTLAGAATVKTSAAEAGVALMCKRQGGSTYLFAVATSPTAATASFAVAGMAGRAEVEVLGEERTVVALDGRFEDAFAGYAVHHYRVAH